MSKKKKAAEKQIMDALVEAMMNDPAIMEDFRRQADEFISNTLANAILNARIVRLPENTERYWITEERVYFTLKSEFPAWIGSDVDFFDEFTEIEG